MSRGARAVAQSIAENRATAHVKTPWPSSLDAAPHHVKVHWLVLSCEQDQALFALDTILAHPKFDCARPFWTELLEATITKLKRLETEHYDPGQSRFDIDMAAIQLAHVRDREAAQLRRVAKTYEEPIASLTRQSIARLVEVLDQTIIALF